jgi:uncharacterized protein YdeI (YjbR/CyaY-like superfamily)
VKASAPNPEVDWYFTKEKAWAKEFAKLRELALASGLTEELKWGHPCYTLDGKNVFLMHGFKDYCALLFTKGALIEDDAGILVQQTANVQSARQIRFAGVTEITKAKRTIATYIERAIAIEKSGAKVERKSTEQFDVPAELAAAFKASKPLATAFQALTPGRQRAYLLHIGSAKQSATRVARIEKHRKRILAGKGLDDE